MSLFNENVNAIIPPRGGRWQVHDKLPPKLHNWGYSYGLAHPFIYRELAGQWLIWDRRTGIIAEICAPHHPMRGMQWCGQRCRALNGMRDPTPAEIARVNAMHDAEP